MPAMMWASSVVPTTEGKAGGLSESWFIGDSNREH
jgi:hypothetical protein